LYALDIFCFAFSLSSVWVKNISALLFRHCMYVEHSVNSQLAIRRLEFNSFFHHFLLTASQRLHSWHRNIIKKPFSGQLHRAHQFEKLISEFTSSFILVMSSGERNRWYELFARLTSPRPPHSMLFSIIIKPWNCLLKSGEPQMRNSFSVHRCWRWDCIMMKLIILQNHKNAKIDRTYFRIIFHSALA
jgi:hypothetical protein